MTFSKMYRILVIVWYSNKYAHSAISKAVRQQIQSRQLCRHICEDDEMCSLRLKGGQSGDGLF